MPLPSSRSARIRAAGVLLALAACTTTPADTSPSSTPPTDDELPTIAEATADTHALAGLLPVHVDDRSGAILLELPPPTGDDRIALRLLIATGLRTGIGSNPIGLDRGQWGDAFVLHVRRLGERVLFELPNLRYRALTDDVEEQRAARESFATSVIWAADVAAIEPDGRTLVDIGPFLLSDLREVAQQLAGTGQGAFTLDAARSIVDTTACLAFPDNLEFEALLTFRSDAPGALVLQTAPDGHAVSVTQHVSLVRLPDDGYSVRELDPRTGAWGLDQTDLAAPLSSPLDRTLAARHRLTPTDPTEERSTVVEPIVYYVDRGAPEPVRSALLEGAGWWADAFEAAGYDDAFRVELLPEGVHPLDVRYHVIEWVHRSTRGWSYGRGLTDPRTGEIIKGHVSLGSLRVRQDRLLFEGLLGTAATGTGAPDDPIELALARIRQLSAHEVGHTLGLAHNFAASVVKNGSVMDYPAPDIGLSDDGELLLDSVYGVGVGPWDEFAIRWLYGSFPPGTDEAAALAGLVAQADADDSLPPYLSDADARPAGAAHPLANLWDNGADPVAGLARSLAVRRVALDRFGPDRVLPGTPLAHLQEVLVPVYFHHRYQLDAALKTIGGLEYEVALAGDGRAPAAMIDPARQQEALAVILSILEPQQLDLPEPVLAWLLPRPPNEERNREMFATRTAPAFDALGAASTAATAVVDGLLQPQRCARLVDFQRRDASQPGLDAVLLALEDAAFAADAATDGARHAALRRTVQQVLVDRLIASSGSADVTPEVRAELDASLTRLYGRLAPQVAATPEGSAHQARLTEDIRRWLQRSRTDAEHPSPAPRIPPGSPIGAVDRLTGCSAGPW